MYHKAIDVPLILLSKIDKLPDMPYRTMMDMTAFALQADPAVARKSRGAYSRIDYGKKSRVVRGISDTRYNGLMAGYYRHISCLILYIKYGKKLREIGMINNFPQGEARPPSCIVYHINRCVHLYVSDSKFKETTEYIFNYIHYASKSPKGEVAESGQPHI